MRPMSFYYCMTILIPIINICCFHALLFDNSHRRSVREEGRGAGGQAALVMQSCVAKK